MEYEQYDADDFYMTSIQLNTEVKTFSFILRLLL